MNEERGTGTIMSSQEENMKRKEIYLLEIRNTLVYLCNIYPWREAINCGHDQWWEVI